MVSAPACVFAFEPTGWPGKASCIHLLSLFCLVVVAAICDGQRGTTASGAVRGWTIQCRHSSISTSTLNRLRLPGKRATGTLLCGYDLGLSTEEVGERSMFAFRVRGVLRNRSCRWEGKTSKTFWRWSGSDVLAATSVGHA